jgi:toxin ParE1/3/4
MILENCQDIADNPNLGRNYEGIKKEIFGFRANQHIIFYRESKDKPIKIRKIFHVKVDFKNRT